MAIDTTKAREEANDEVSLARGHLRALKTLLAPKLTRRESLVGLAKQALSAGENLVIEAKRMSAALAWFEKWFELAQTGAYSDLMVWERTNPKP